MDPTPKSARTIEPKSYKFVAWYGLVMGALCLIAAALFKGPVPVLGILLAGAILLGFSTMAFGLMRTGPPAGPTPWVMNAIVLVAPVVILMTVSYLGKVKGMGQMPQTSIPAAIPTGH